MATELATAPPTADPTPEPSDEPTPEPSATPEPVACPIEVDEGPGTVAGPDSDAPRPGVVGDASIAREPPTISLEQVVGGLSKPIGIANAGDGSGRLFVLEQAGRIRVVADGVLLAEPFLTISSLVTSGGERGLLGLAFHPDYSTNGRFFVNYTDLCGNTAIAEYRVSDDDPNLADPRPVEILLQVVQPFPNHNGGGLAFGPDGMLYIATGDGGSAGDPLNMGQRLDTLLGKLLRIDVDGRESDRPYGLPGNRFASRHLAHPEIYATGLRNPWRFSFDRDTGDLWIGDVGQGGWEEIDALPYEAANGVNFGWNLLEGRDCYVEDPCDTGGYVAPVAVYDHRDGDCAVTGGYVHRGQAPALRGWYLFADACSGTFRAIDPLAGAAPPVSVVLQSSLAVVTFGEGEDGELYVADIAGGGIHRIVAR
ncbi:MAG: glucose dehydrogenase [Chloroflexi bacterium]|nr:glucose dehydrogenase [Chloroflexota bacterium]